MKKETKKNNNLGPWVVIFLVVIIGVAIIGIVINKNKTKPIQTQYNIVPIWNR